LLVSVVACGGGTLTGPRAGDDAGSGTGSGTGTAPPGTCNLARIIPPILTVVNAVTGADICDATLVSFDGGTAELSPCAASDGCTGTCQYTVRQEGSYGSPFTITIAAPGYLQGVSPELTTETCGCEGACAPEQQATVKLHPDIISPPAAPACPTSAPSSQASCSAPSTLTCEYGTNPDPDCDQLWQCVGGKWSEQTGPACPALPSCPATPPSDASSCSAAQLACPYAASTCLCTDDPGGLATAGGPVWDCTPITAGCPSPRPDLGTPCNASSTLDCDYGQCSGGVGLTCVDGTWQLAEVACPV